MFVHQPQHMYIYAGRFTAALHNHISRIGFVGYFREVSLSDVSQSLNPHLFSHCNILAAQIMLAQLSWALPDKIFVHLETSGKMFQSKCTHRRRLEINVKTLENLVVSS